MTFKTTILQDFFLTTIATDINVTINSLYLYIPILVPSTNTQGMVNDCNMNNLTITFDSLYTERKTSNDGRELQVDIGSAQHVNCPKCLIAVFKILNRMEVPNKANIIAVFDKNHVIKHVTAIDEIRCPRDGVSANFEEISYLYQYRELKLFYEEYDGEQLRKTYISYTDMKNFYPIQIIDLSFQVDDITPKKIQLY